MAFSDVHRLRRKLGETIPAEGTEADTLFTNAQLEDILDDAGRDMTTAAYLGWQAKAAEYANLVTVTEGNSSRNMTDLHTNALKMVKHYEGLVATAEVEAAGRGRVVIGTISRSARYR